LGRELLQLADTYNPAKHKIAGHWISEKLDGTRCFWDGGISRGCRTEDVPWAGITDPKKGTKKNKIKPIASGLWSRYGNPIIAPDDFLNSLPCCPLDGELWAGRGKFQLCRSICAGDTPDPRFHLIKFAVYSSPAFPTIFSDGEIKNAQMVCNIERAAIEKWVKKKLERVPDFRFVDWPATFNDELMFLREFIETQNDTVYIHQQVKLPDDEDEARAFANDFIEKVLDLGGEGAVIRDGKAKWIPKRHKGLLKFKPYEDSEAVVVGFRSGKEGKQGNVLGKIGTLIVRWGEIEFEIGSGLTFENRAFKDQLMSEHAASNPGEVMPPNFEGKHIGKGDTITFKYRELTDDGIPKEGRYWRKREVE
jgi:DNA ligase-1